MHVHVLCVCLSWNDVSAVTVTVRDGVPLLLQYNSYSYITTVQWYSKVRHTVARQIGRIRPSVQHIARTIDQASAAHARTCAECHTQYRSVQDGARYSMRCCPSILQRDAAHKWCLQAIGPPKGVRFLSNSVPRALVHT